MKTNGFKLRPDTCPFCAIDVLNYLVLNDGEYVAVLVIFLPTNIGSYIDEESASLKRPLAFWDAG